MEPETEQILENIRKIRKEKRIAYDTLANEVNIARSHMYYIECKKVIPSIDVLVRIAKSLGVGPGELIEKSADKWVCKYLTFVL